MKRTCTIWVGISLVLLPALSIAAYVNPGTVTAARVYNKSAPIIDGVFDHIWNQGTNKLEFSKFQTGVSGRYTIDNQHYDTTDPSVLTVYFLHDDFNLYIAMRTNDKQIEKSNYDQNADGLAGLGMEIKNSTDKSIFRLMMHQEHQLYEGAQVLVGPSLDRDRMVYDAEWRSEISGTWNNNGDMDTGYTYEIRIPLSKLGGYLPGDQIKSNIVVVDHDSNPNGSFDDSFTNFCKYWWSADKAEHLNGNSYISLSDSAPIGATSGDNATIIAKKIDPLSAPVIDGDPKDDIWNEAASEGTLNFPNSMGESWGPGTQAVYNSFDPGTYTMKFLHDDSYLYVAFTAHDNYVENSAYDQDSDGLVSFVFDTNNHEFPKDNRYSYYWDELDLWDQRDMDPPKEDVDGKTLLNPVDIHFQQGPPRYPYMTEHVTWAPAFDGTYNDNTDTDGLYTAEFKIPLSDLGISSGHQIAANIVIVDHDKNPGGAHNDSDTRFRKFWWGSDKNEFYDPATGIRHSVITTDKERYIRLGIDVAVGDPPALTPTEKALEYVAGQQIKYTGLLRSYQQEQVAHLYDNAVGLITLIDGKKTAEADKLAEAMISLLEDDPVYPNAAFFYDAYGAIDKKHPQGAASGTGPNTWAAYALAIYGITYNNQPALDAANKIANWVLNRMYDPSDGGVWGGIGHHFEERPEENHVNDIVFNFKSTEQVIDAWHLFNILRLPEKHNVQAWLFSEGKGWVATDPLEETQYTQDNRFSTGVNSENVDRRLFLDTQAWGSIVATLANKPIAANDALLAAETWMQETQEIGGQMIIGYNDACLPEDNAIWYGGTAHMIVAYQYKGDVASAASYLASMANVQNTDGSWNHSSKESYKEYHGPFGDYSSFHSIRPHVGETSWNYFALRDVNDNRSLPYFRLFCWECLPNRGGWRAILN